MEHDEARIYMVREKHLSVINRPGVPQQEIGLSGLYPRSSGPPSRLPYLYIRCSRYISLTCIPALITLIGSLPLERNEPGTSFFQ